METLEKDEQVVEKAVKLSLIEIVLGSVLHTMRIPFSGHFLSLNQGLFLIRANTKSSNRFVAAKSAIEISMVVAIMKSLSPAGKKLGPMISISLQGVLFSIGTLIGGTNLIGNILAIFLLSLWAFIQPLVTYFLIYGSDLIAATQYFLGKLKKYIDVSNDTLLSVVFGLVVLKFVFGLFVVFTNRYFQDAVDKYYRRLGKIQSSKLRDRRNLPVMQGVFKDMTSPFFLLSFVLMSAFFIFHGQDNALILWKILRTLAIAFILFYLARATWFVRAFEKLSLKNKMIKRIFSLSRLAYGRLLNH